MDYIKVLKCSDNDINKCKCTGEGIQGDSNGVEWGIFVLSEKDLKLEFKFLYFLTLRIFPCSFRHSFR